MLGEEALKLTEEEIKQAQCPYDYAEKILSAAEFKYPEEDMKQIKQAIKKMQLAEKEGRANMEKQGLSKEQQDALMSLLDKAKEPMKLGYASLVASVKASESGKSPYSYTIEGGKGEKPRTVTCKKIQPMTAEVIGKMKKDMQEMAATMGEEDPFPPKLKETGEGKAELRKGFLSVVKHPIFWIFIFILVVLIVRTQVKKQWKAERYQAVGISGYR